MVESFAYPASAGFEADKAFVAAVLTFVLRGIVGGLWNHPTYTAITGAGVGYFFAGKASKAKRWLMMNEALLAAMILHGLFDSPLLEQGNPLVSTIVKGIPALVLFIILLRIARRRERAVFTGVATDDVPTEFVTSAELETLLTRRDRKKARKIVRKSQGTAAAHALKRLQRSQVEYVAAVSDYGAGSDVALALGDDVRDERAVVASVQTP